MGGRAIGAGRLCQHGSFRLVGGIVIEAKAKRTGNPVRLSYLMERKTRFELATPSLARTCSTAELLPRVPRSIAAVRRYDNESAK